MSSLSQDPSKMDHHYQSSEASDHGLLGHTHACTCCREVSAPPPPKKKTKKKSFNLLCLLFQCTEKPETPKTEHIHGIAKSSPHHQHRVINLSHSHLQTSHVHLSHHHVPPSPKAGNQGAKLSGTCTCNLKVTDNAASYIIFLMLIFDA